MTYFIITVGILGIIGLAALVLVTAYVGHLLVTANRTLNAIEENIGESLMMVHGDMEEVGLPEQAVEEIMRHIRGETPEMKNFLQQLDDEDDTDLNDDTM